MFWQRRLLGGAVGALGAHPGAVLASVHPGRDARGGGLVVLLELPSS